MVMFDHAPYLAMDFSEWFTLIIFLGIWLFGALGKFLSGKKDSNTTSAKPKARISDTRKRLDELAKQRRRELQAQTEQRRKTATPKPARRQPASKPAPAPIQSVRIAPAFQPRINPPLKPHIKSAPVDIPVVARPMAQYVAPPHADHPAPKHEPALRLDLSRQALRQAIVLQEVFSPPLALRDPMHAPFDPSV